MWSALFEFAVVLAAAWLVVRIIRRAITGSRSAESAEPTPGDFAGSPAKLHPRPKSGAGAIALAEPDDENE
jgi:hypothetical protein